MPGKQGRSTNWLTVMMGGKIPLPEVSLNNDLIQRMAKNNDIAMITIGRNSRRRRQKQKKAIFIFLRRKRAHKPCIEAFHKEGKKPLLFCLLVSSKLQVG